MLESFLSVKLQFKDFELYEKETFFVTTLIVEKKKKIQKVTNFNLQTSGKKFFIVFRGVFKSQSNIYDGAFFGK